MTPVDEEDGEGYLEINFTWNPNITVSLSELDDYHIHTDEYKEYIYYYSTYHRWYIDCGYSKRNENGVLESCTYENDECVYCHHKKEEA